MQHMRKEILTIAREDLNDLPRIKVEKLNRVIIPVTLDGKKYEVIYDKVFSNPYTFSWKLKDIKEVI